MDNIGRYRCDPNSVMLCADDGEWVLYEDVEALRARLEEVERILAHDRERLQKSINYWEATAKRNREEADIYLSERDLARQELAKYKAFWDRAREVDKMNFELYDWPTKEKAGG